MSTQFLAWAEKIESVDTQWRAHAVVETLRDKKMLPIFGRLFFGDEIGNEIPELHFQIASHISSPKNEAIIVPRGHGKTTWFRIDLIHDIVYELEPFTVLVGDSSNAAKRSLNYIRKQFETNQMLIQTYGDMVPAFSPKKARKWTDSHIETTTGINVIAVGVGKGRGLNIGGRRPSKCLIDDMEDRDGVRSEDIRKKQKEWLYQTLLPAMDKDTGKVKMIGTVLHYDCILLDFYRKFGGIKRAAIEDEDGRPSLDGEPIWWSKERLDDMKKSIGTFSFAQEFMNDPATDEFSDVKMNWIVRLNEDQIRLMDENGDYRYNFISALDPNISTKQTADDAAICTIAVNKKDKNDIIVLNIEHGKWGMTRTLDMCKRVYDRYPHQAFYVESVAFQEHLRQVIAEAGVPAKPITVSKDKRARLQKHVGKIEFGVVKFAPHTEDLITQLVQFPNGKHDDCVDSMVHCLDMVTNQKGFLFVVLGDDDD